MLESWRKGWGLPRLKHLSQVTWYVEIVRHRKGCMVLLLCNTMFTAILNRNHSDSRTVFDRYRFWGWLGKSELNSIISAILKSFEGQFVGDLLEKETNLLAQTTGRGAWGASYSGLWASISRSAIFFMTLSLILSFIKKKFILFAVYRSLAKVCISLIFHQRVQITVIHPDQSE